MKNKDVTEWIEKPSFKQVLLAFYSPRTPRMAEYITGIKKLKLKPFLEMNLLKDLNPRAEKGRLYVITEKARRLLQLPSANNRRRINWHIVGWLMASPRQRVIVLKAVNLQKRTSEEIRERAYNQNPHLSRISTKSILQELIHENLVKTEMTDRKRYYSISKDGIKIKEQLESGGFMH
jgi:predicted transcriptional regulator